MLVAVGEEQTAASRDESKGTEPATASRPPEEEDTVMEEDIPNPGLEAPVAPELNSKPQKADESKPMDTGVEEARPARKVSGSTNGPECESKPQEGTGQTLDTAMEDAEARKVSGSTNGPDCESKPQEGTGSKPVDAAVEDAKAREVSGSTNGPECESKPQGGTGSKPVDTAVEDAEAREVSGSTNGPDRESKPQEGTGQALETAAVEDAKAREVSREHEWSRQRTQATGGDRKTVIGDSHGRRTWGVQAEDSKPTDAAMATSGPADQVAAGGPDLNGTGEGQNQHGADNILAGTPRGEPGMDDRREADTALAM